MSQISRLVCFILTAVCALPVSAQGPPPMGMCPGRIEGFPAMEPGRPCPKSFMEVFKKPPCEKPMIDDLLAVM